MTDGIKRLHIISNGLGLDGSVASRTINFTLINITSTHWQLAISAFDKQRVMYLVLAKTETLLIKNHNYVVLGHFYQQKNRLISCSSLTSQKSLA